MEAIALMGTINERKRVKGVRYTAQIRIKRDGAVIHSDVETFSKRDAANPDGKTARLVAAGPRSLNGYTP